MHVKTFSYLDFLNLFKNQESEKIGLYFSFVLHLIFFIFVIDFPNFFKSPPINIPTVIPIEIINVSDITSIPKEIDSTQKKDKVIDTTEQKKFNTIKPELIKKVELKTKTKENIKDLKSTEIKTNKFNSIQPELTKPELIKNVKIKTKPEKNIDNSKVVKIKQRIEENTNNLIKKDIDVTTKIIVDKIESLPTKVIRPRIKPKPNSTTTSTQQDSDIRAKIKPKPEPEPSFNIASMMKDIRNEQSSIQKQKNEKKEKDDQKILNKKDEITHKNVPLSISEINLLYQQLYSCWIAPAGSKVENWWKISISANIEPNGVVIKDTIRIVDTNIPKDSPFYYPITEAAIRTLRNPDCIPLKLPMDKYNEWKNLKINFDLRMMKKN